MTEAAVEQTLIAIHEALADCLGRMPDCDVAATAATYATGALRDGVLDILTSMSERGIRIDNVDSRTIVVESIQIDENANEASAITCENDGAVQTRPDGTIEDDTYVSRRRDWSLVLQDGRWLAVDSVLLEEAIGEGNGLCDA